MRIWCLSHRRVANAQTSLRSVRSRQSIRSSNTHRGEIDKDSEQIIGV